MAFQFGIDNLLSQPGLVKRLKSAKVGLVAHPASITGDNRHTLDVLIKAGCNVVKAFGPQHGMRGDKQDNMIESPNYLDPFHGIPVISLYGEHRKPTTEMMADLDIILFDLQDIGCRIYTYITTLFYFCESCSKSGSELWILDRPNPAGRPIDGVFLEPGEESFVGCASLPTRHGLTVGELASYFESLSTRKLDQKIITMKGYQCDKGPGYGWPILERPWVNPSPNASSLNMVRCFPGTVLLEGTTLSEGRGTTIPLEVIGAPELPVQEILTELERDFPDSSTGVLLRLTYFSPTFHKHSDKLCTGIQIHTDYPQYQHNVFKPYRLIAGFLKALRGLLPGYNLWRHHDYEYEIGRIPIDVINGGSWLRAWVDDNRQGYNDLDQALEETKSEWQHKRAPHLIYP